MKWMKSDARSVRIKDWVSKNMINIYRHGRQHDKIGISPIGFKKNSRNYNRENKVQKIMKDFAQIK